MYGFIESTDNVGIWIGTDPGTTPHPMYMRRTPGAGFAPYTLPYNELQQIFSERTLKYQGITREQVQRNGLPAITAKLKANVTSEQINAAYRQYYTDKPLIRLYEQGFPSIKAVEFTPYCDIGFAVKNGHIIIIGAEDNLLKGAASQAVQYANIRFDFNETAGLIS